MYSRHRCRNTDNSVMFTVLYFSVLVIAAQSAFASPIKVRTEYAVKETHLVPRHWTPTGRAPEDHKLHLKIGLKQCRFNELEQHLLEGQQFKFLLGSLMLAYDASLNTRSP
jgi:hypothetical protein